MQQNQNMTELLLNELNKAINEISSNDEVYGRYKEGFKELYRVIKPSLEYQAELKRIIADKKDLYSPNIEDYILILRKILNKDLIIPEPLVGSWSEISCSSAFLLYLEMIS